MINNVIFYPVNFFGIKHKKRSSKNSKEKKKDDISSEDIAIILDSCNNKFVVPGIEHGRFVYYIAKYSIINPKIKLIGIDTRIRTQNNDDIEKFIKELVKIAKDIKNGKKIKAINISASFQSMDFNLLAEFTGLPVNRKNIYLYREQALNAFFKYPFSKEEDIEKIKLLKKGMKLLEHLAKKVKIFTSAGNGGPDNIDLESLVKGVITVGALDKNGKIAKYSSDHSLIYKFESGYLDRKLIKNFKREIKFKKLKVISSNIDMLKYAKGTSASSALAMAKYLNNPKYLEEKDPHCMY